MQQPADTAAAGSTSRMRMGDGQPASDGQQAVVPISFGRGLPEDGRGAGERDLLAFVAAQFAGAERAIARPLVVDYYIALKAHRFAVLLGPRGQGKFELVHAFAEALVGASSEQMVSIQTHPPRSGPAAEQSFFSGLYERFSWIKFTEFLERAAAPENTGKPYFLCLEDLRPLDVETYFQILIQGDRPDERRLALPGYPPNQYPVVPANLFITAVVNDDEGQYQFSETVLCRIGVIELEKSRRLCLPPITPAERLPPVGLQRLMLGPIPRDNQQTLQRLQDLVGPQRAERLEPRPALARLLEATGLVFEARALEHIRRYIAMSFDDEGHGLFDPDDRWRNYQLALDLQMARQALLRIRSHVSAELQLVIEAYLEALFTSFDQHPT